jgi:uncharacterized protein (TIGR01244 family)
MSTIKRLAPGVFVSGQIQPDAIPKLQAAGIGLIINNRPDGEQPDQPTAAEIGEAARAAGIDYIALPVRGMPTPAMGAAVAKALSGSKGEALIFCRSGMRSAAAWALGAVDAGQLSVNAAREHAADAGYDLSGLPL